MKEDKLRNIIKELPHKHKDECVLSEYEILQVILKHKYPTGLPLLPNATGGATLIDVYPEEYDLAKAIHSKMRENINETRESSS